MGRVCANVCCKEFRPFDQTKVVLLPGPKNGRECKSGFGCKASASEGRPKA